MLLFCDERWSVVARAKGKGFALPMRTNEDFNRRLLAALNPPLAVGEVAPVKKQRKKPTKKLVWVIRGGVGGTMYLGSAASVGGFSWKIRLCDSRKFTTKEYAEKVCRRAGGRVEKVVAEEPAAG